jgi:hypothetical protein
MAEQTTGLFSRIANLFGGGRRSRLNHDELGLSTGLDDSSVATSTAATPTQLLETRRHGAPVSGSIFRPWAKRDQALQNLSEGFVTLTQLMSAIRDSLEKQQHRHDELMNLLGRLPQIIEGIPEANRTQAEALRTIYEQLAASNNAQSTLGEVLNKIVDNGGEQRKLIDALNDQLDSLRQTDSSISENLSNVGSAMQTLGTTSQTSVQVLQQVQESLRQRDEAVQHMLERQSHRFNFILWLSVVLAITTIVSLVMVTYIAMRP